MATCRAIRASSRASLPGDVAGGQHRAHVVPPVQRGAIREYVENQSRAALLDQVLDEELPRYAEALERLGQ